MSTKPVLGMFILFGIFFIIGCSNISIITEPINVTILELNLSPQNYLNKTIQLEATLIFVGENYFAQKGDFYLKESDARIQVQSWAPITVAQCPIDVECNPPAVMSDYLNKRVRITGQLKEFSKTEYINNQWQTTGTYYAVVSEKAEII